jgi:cyclin-dependent kinase 7
MESIGEGGYGKVYKAYDEVNKTYVALKKSKLTPIDDGIGFVTLREVKFLKEFKHPNLIKLTDIYAHKKKIYLVFEYMETDLEEVIGDTDIILSAPDIKAYMKMLLSGVKFLHENWILHRVCFVPLILGFEAW